MGNPMARKPRDESTKMIRIVGMDCVVAALKQGNGKWQATGYFAGRLIQVGGAQSMRTAYQEWEKSAECYAADPE